MQAKDANRPVVRAFAIADVLAVNPAQCALSGLNKKALYCGNNRGR